VAFDHVLWPCRGGHQRDLGRRSGALDLIGKAANMPVWRLLGGATKTRIPAYCTGNDIEQHIEFGYKRLKLALPYGPPTAATV